MARTRGSWNTSSILVVGAAAAGTLTGYLMFGGDDSASSTPARGGIGSSISSPAGPPPSYAAPNDWTEPERWAALPRGQGTDKQGNQMLFPHTTEGAVAMMVAANTTVIEGDRTTVDEQLRIFRTYVSSSEQSPKSVAKLKATAEELHGRLRLLLPRRRP
ncbi:hypothetical protein ACPCSC_33005 [Streptomyces lavendulocolor]|uniref:hypothetical protein n=1 Tax=Streptomyces lavendulocolor TaxID=67316 RepID=UPI003C2C8A97